MKCCMVPELVGSEKDWEDMCVAVSPGGKQCWGVGEQDSTCQDLIKMGEAILGGIMNSEYRAG